MSFYCSCLQVNGFHMFHIPKTDPLFRTGGKLFSCSQDHTPFDVVAWHGKLVTIYFILFIICSHMMIVMSHTSMLWRSLSGLEV